MFVYTGLNNFSSHFRPVNVLVGERGSSNSCKVVTGAAAQGKGELTHGPAADRAEPAKNQVSGMPGFFKVSSSAGGNPARGGTQPGSHAGLWTEMQYIC